MIYGIILEFFQSQTFRSRLEEIAEEIPTGDPQQVLRVQPEDSRSDIWSVEGMPRKGLNLICHLSQSGSIAPLFHMIITSAQ